MADNKSKCYSGIGGQAVLEGVMMKNKEKYAVAVRKPDGEIVVDVQTYGAATWYEKFTKIPFVRGIFNFVDSMILGMRCLNYSASFFEEEEEKETTPAKEKLINTIVTLISIVLAVGLFILLPFFLSNLCRKVIDSDPLMAVIEGVIRLAIFLLYVWGISLMNDIKRLYCYHGAEHKCINCIESGNALTVENVKKSSRLHKRCGTSFIFFVLIISIVLFFFIRVDSQLQRIALRLLLLPVVAGISYEMIRLAGKSDNPFVRMISVPGMLIQKITTGEPDEKMIEVAIASVEAVYDWKQFLKDNFGYKGEGDAPASETTNP